MGEMKNNSVETMSALAAQIDSAKEKLRAFCEAEELLPTYEEVHEDFLGKDAYPGYKLKNWLRNNEFLHDALNSTLAYYRISMVMACIVGAHHKLKRGKPAGALKRLEKADAWMQELPSLLPNMYWDLLAKKLSSAQLGALSKKIRRNFCTILKCLKVNHDLQGVDFKSFDEAVSYAIEMMIHDEKIEDAKTLKELRRFYPEIFSRWLWANPEEAGLFESYTGFSCG